MERRRPRGRPAQDQGQLSSTCLFVSLGYTLSMFNRTGNSSKKLQALSAREEALAQKLGQQIAIRYGYTPASLAFLETLIHGDAKETFFAALQGALYATQETPTQVLWQNYLARRFHQAYPTDTTAQTASASAAKLLGQLKQAHRQYRQALKKALDNVSFPPFKHIRDFITQAQTLMEYSHLLKPTAQRRLSNRILGGVVQTRALVLQDSSQTYGLKEGLLEFFNTPNPAQDAHLRQLQEQLSLAQVTRASLAGSLARPA